MTNHENKGFVPEHERWPRFKIDLPAKPSPDNHCLQASIGMVLESLSPGEVPDLEELESVRHKKEGLGTWPGWMLSWLNDQGYKVEMYSNVDWKHLSENPGELIETFVASVDSH